MAIENNSKSRRSLYIVFLILLTFFVISFLTNILGSIIPKIQENFQLSKTLVLLLPSAFFIAYGVMSIPANFLNERFKEKKMMAAAFVVSFGASLLLAFFPNYLTAIVSLFLIGCGMAILQVVVNPLLRIAGGEEHYAFNSVLAQLIFGAASFVSPFVYTYFAKNLGSETSGGFLLDTMSRIVPLDLPWISLYWLFAAISVAMVLVILASRFPKVELKADEEMGSLDIFSSLLKKRFVWLFFLGILVYVGTEQGVGNSISLFLKEYHGFDPEGRGAQAVAFFWGAMTIGGLLGLVLLKIMDSKLVLILFTSLAIVSYSFGLFSGNGEVAYWGLILVGFFASVMYPIIFSLSLNSIKSHQGTFAGILLTGIIGGAITPPIIGWIGDHFGLRAGMLIIYITLAYILSVGFWAKPLINNKTIQAARREKLNQKGV